MRNRDGLRDQGAPVWAVGAAVVLTVAIALAGFLAISSWLAESTATESAERVRYTHQAAFTYDVALPPSSLYPGGRVGPFEPGNADAPATLYTAGPVRADMIVKYNLLAPEGSRKEVSDFSGEISADVVVSAGERSWRKPLMSSGPVAFTGTTGELPLVLDFAEVEALVARIENETGFKPPAYTVSVMPIVQVRGTLDGERVSDSFSASYNFSWSRSQVGSDPELTRSQPRLAATTSERTQSITTPAGTYGVVSIRWFSLALLLLSCILAAPTFGYLFFGLWRGEAARIRARYGSLLVSVANDSIEQDPARRIHLRSIADLMRLAKKDNRMVLDRLMPDGTHVYSVTDGGLTYLFVTDGSEAVPSSVDAAEQC